MGKGGELSRFWGKKGKLMRQRSPRMKNQGQEDRLQQAFGDNRTQQCLTGTHSKINDEILEKSK